MEKNELKELVGKLKPFLLDYLEETGRKPNKDFFINCPAPDHEDKHPSASIEPKRGLLHCFACGKSYDLISLYMQDTGATFAEAINRLSAKYLGEGQAPQIAERKQTRPGDFGQFLKPMGSEAAISYLAGRGFCHAEKLALWLGIKSDSHFIYFPHRNLTEGEAGEAVGLVTDYQRRAFHETGKQGRYKHAGKVTLFDPLQVFAFDYKSRLVIVTEGEIDAMTVYDIKADGGEAVEPLEAVALSGAQNARLLAEALERGGHTPKGFILCLDGDEAGQSAAKEAAKILEAKKAPYFIATLPNGWKDLNEALQADRATLSALLGDWAACFDELAGLQVTQEEAEREEYRRRNSANSALSALFSAISEGEGRKPIKTGFEALDAVFNGSIKPGIMTIGGLSSMGKTTFLLQTAEQMAAAGLWDIVYFSLEQDLTELVAKSLSRFSFIACMKKPAETATLARSEEEIEQGHRYKQYTAEQLARISQAARDYAALADRLFLIAPDPNRDRYTAADIAEAVREHIAKTGNRPIIFIDYLQYLDGFNDRETDRQALDHNFKVLRSLAKAEGLLIVLLSSIGRASYNAAIDQASFKESGKIEYSSDYLLGLDLTALRTGAASDLDPFRDSQGIKKTVEEGKAKDPREITITLLKARGAPAFQKVNFHYYARYNCFIELKAGKEHREPLLRLLQALERKAKKAEEDLPF